MRAWLGCFAYASITGCALMWRIKEAEKAAANPLFVPANSTVPLEANMTQGVNRTAATVMDEEAMVLGALMESQLSMFVLFNCLCSIYVLTAISVKDLFFGRLTIIESHKLTERAIKYISFKVVFVGAYVSPDVVSLTAWFAWFAVLGFVKLFVGLCKDRFEWLMSAPNATALAHARTALLLVLLLSGTCWWSWVVCSHVWTGPVSELLLLMFECVLIVVDSTTSLVRYGIHLVDTWRRSKMDAVEGLGAHATWEWQGTVLYYTELVSDLLTLGVTFCHYCHIWYLHGLSFQLIDGILFLNIRSVLVSLRKRISAFRRYLVATHNVCTIFQDADPSELAHNRDDCAICREPMAAAKQLPCGHLFHLQCLRAWLQQSGSDNFTCPICRAPLHKCHTTSDSPQAGAGAGGIGFGRLLRTILGTVAAGPTNLQMNMEIQWGQEGQQFMVVGFGDVAGFHGGHEEPGAGNDGGMDGFLAAGTDSDSDYSDTVTSSLSSGPSMDFSGAEYDSSESASGTSASNGSEGEEDFCSAQHANSNPRDGSILQAVSTHVQSGADRLAGALHASASAAASLLTGSSMQGGSQEGGRGRPRVVARAEEGEEVDSPAPPQELPQHGVAAVTVQRRSARIASRARATSNGDPSHGR